MTLEEAYKLLGLEEGTSEEQVRAAFEEKMNAPELTDEQKEQLKTACEVLSCKQCEEEAAESEQPEAAQEQMEEKAEEVTAEVPSEEKKPLPIAKLAFAVVAVIALVAVLAGIVLGGKIPAAEPEAAAPAGTVQQENQAAIEYTVPADGNPDDVTCKGTYTAEDAAVVAARDTVVATAGDVELTLAQLQVYYWMEVRNFLSQYGAYAAYFGLEAAQPLDTQLCNLNDEVTTWQHYFIQTALNSWQNYLSMAKTAEAAGFELPEDYAELISSTAAELESTAVQNGFENAADMIHKSLGNAADVEDYVYFMKLYYTGYSYYDHVASGIHPTDEELDAFFAAHQDEYIESGITKEKVNVDVRHILIYPEGADSATIRTGTFSDEAWASGEASAQAILDRWLAGDMTEESFAALANEHSGDPGSSSNGGLYTGVEEGQMVPAFNDWCFDSARQVGDYGIVKTEYGYHIMYFSGSTPVWKGYVESDYVSTELDKVLTTAVDGFPLKVDYSKILLGNVNIMG